MTPILLAQLAELFRREARDAEKARHRDAPNLFAQGESLQEEARRLGFEGDPFAEETASKTASEAKPILWRPT